MHRLTLLAAPGLVLALVASPAARPLALPTEERARLHRGEVVFLDQMPPGGHVRPDQGGTAMAVVHASPDTIWHILVGYPRHRGLYPRVVEAEVLDSTPARTLVRYVIGVGPFTFGFYINNFPDAARLRIDWRLDQGRVNGLFRDSWGYWELVPEPDGVLLTYAMAARTVLPAFLTRGTERPGLIRTVEAVRERAERQERGNPS